MPVLSHREREILEMVDDGFTFGEIAIVYGCEIKAIDDELTEIFERLGSNDATHDNRSKHGITLPERQLLTTH